MFPCSVFQEGNVLMSRVGAPDSAGVVSGRVLRLSPSQHFPPSRKRSAVAAHTSRLFVLLLLCFASHSDTAAAQTNDDFTAAVFANSGSPDGRQAQSGTAATTARRTLTNAGSRTATKTATSKPIKAAGTEAKDAAAAVSGPTRSPPACTHSGAGKRKAAKGSEQRRTGGYAARATSAEALIETSAVVPQVAPAAAAAKETREDALNATATAQGAVSEAGVDNPVGAAAVETAVVPSSGAHAAAAVSPVMTAPEAAPLIKPPDSTFVKKRRYGHSRLLAPTTAGALAMLRAAPSPAVTAQKASLKKSPATATKKRWLKKGRNPASVMAAALAADATPAAMTSASPSRSAPASAGVATATATAVASPFEASPISAAARSSKTKTEATREELQRLSTAQLKDYRESEAVKNPAMWSEESVSVTDIRGAAGSASKRPTRMRRHRAALRWPPAAVEDSVSFTELSVSSDPERGYSSSEYASVPYSERDVHWRRERRRRRIPRLAGRDPRVKIVQMHRRRRSNDVALKKLLGAGGETFVSLAAILSLTAFLIGVTLRHAKPSESLHKRDRSGSQQQGTASNHAGGSTHFTREHVADRRSSRARKLVPADASRVGGDATASAGAAENGGPNFLARLQHRWWGSRTPLERALICLAVYMFVIWFTQKTSKLSSLLQKIGPRVKEDAGWTAFGRPTRASVVESLVNTEEEDSQHTAGWKDQNTKRHRKQPPRFQEGESVEAGRKYGFLRSTVHFLLNCLLPLETALVVIILPRIAKGLLQAGEDNPPARRQTSLRSLLRALKVYPFLSKDTSAGSKPALPTTSGERLAAEVLKAEDDVLTFISEATDSEQPRVTVATKEELLEYIKHMKQEKNPVKQALKVAAVRELVARWTIDRLMQDLGDTEGADDTTQDARRRHSSSSSIKSTESSQEADTSPVRLLTRQEQLNWCMKVAEHARSAIAWTDEEKRLLHLMTTTGGHPGSSSSSTDSLTFLSTAVPTSTGNVVERTAADRYLALRRSYYSKYMRRAEAEMKKLDALTLTEAHSDDVRGLQMKSTLRVDLFQAGRSADLRAVQEILRGHPQVAQLLPTYRFSWRMPLP